jgi:hypothetical protein
LASSTIHSGASAADRLSEVRVCASFLPTRHAPRPTPRALPSLRAFVPPCLRAFRHINPKPLPNDPRRPAAILYSFDPPKDQLRPGLSDG